MCHSSVKQGMAKTWKLAKTWCHAEIKVGKGMIGNVLLMMCTKFCIKDHSGMTANQLNS